MPSTVPDHDEIGRIESQRSARGPAGWAAAAMAKPVEAGLAICGVGVMVWSIVTARYFDPCEWLGLSMFMVGILIISEG
jgi:hypothetical protein